MELEKAVGPIAVGWLIGSIILMARSIRRGFEDVLDGPLRD